MSVRGEDYACSCCHHACGRCHVESIACRVALRIVMRNVPASLSLPHRTLRQLEPCSTSRPERDASPTRLREYASIEGLACAAWHSHNESSMRAGVGKRVTRQVATHLLRMTTCQRFKLQILFLRTYRGTRQSGGGDALGGIGERAHLIKQSAFRTRSLLALRMLCMRTSVIGCSLVTVTTEATTVFHFLLRGGSLTIPTRLRWSAMG